LQRILIIYRLRILSLASTFHKNETIVESIYVNYVHRLYGGLFFLRHSVYHQIIWIWYTGCWCCYIWYNEEGIGWVPTSL